MSSWHCACVVKRRIARAQMHTSTLCVRGENAALQYVSDRVFRDARASVCVRTRPHNMCASVHTHTRTFVCTYRCICGCNKLHATHTNYMHARTHTCVCVCDARCNRATPQRSSLARRCAEWTCCRRSTGPWVPSCGSSPPPRCACPLRPSPRADRPPAVAAPLPLIPRPCLRHWTCPPACAGPPGPSPTSGAGSPQPLRGPCLRGTSTPPNRRACPLCRSPSPERGPLAVPGPVWGANARALPLATESRRVCGGAIAVPVGLTVAGAHHSSTRPVGA